MFEDDYTCGFDHITSICYVYTYFTFFILCIYIHILAHSSLRSILYIVNVKFFNFIIFSVMFFSFIVLLDVQERSHNFVIISIYDFVFFDEGVKTEYKFYKNKVYIGTTRGPFFNVTGLKSSTVYKIEVEIFHNNISVGSTFITVETSLLGQSFIY